MATNRSFFRTVRITTLLFILFFVAMNSWLTKMRSTDWKESLWVVVYPINGDGSPATSAYIESLKVTEFEPVESFLSREAHEYGLAIHEPVTIRLAPEVTERPPLPPERRSILSIAFWSLKLRYWAYFNDTFEGPEPDVQMFVVYHDPARNARVPHSLGLEKGLIGVVNAYAGHELAQKNNVVIAHEFLHTVGATDKYNPANNQPDYPHGYADPDLQPLYPQHKAEIMGGRIPLSDQLSVMPNSVSFSMIGPKTAREIRWIN